MGAPGGRHLPHEGRLRGEAPRLDQLDGLDLLDRVVRESLRLLPPVPVATRVTAAEVDLGPSRLPPATEVHLSIYHAHRAADLYQQPRRFLPGRWQGLASSPYEYLPCGAGPGCARAPPSPCS